MLARSTIHPGTVPAVLLVLSTASLPVGIDGQEPTAAWRGGVGVGLALDLGGTDQAVDAVGLGTHAVVTRRTGRDLAWGLQWDGAWFDGDFATEKRFLLSAIVEAPLGETPLHLRIGPGIGLATVVEVDRPEPGVPGDALISIGDHGAWGMVAGVTGRWKQGAAAVEPLASLMWHRTGGISRGSQSVFTLVVGGRLHLGG